MIDCGSIDSGSTPDKHTKKLNMRRKYRIDVLFIVMIVLLAVTSCYYKNKSDMYRKMYNSCSYKPVSSEKIDYILIKNGKAI